MAKVLLGPLADVLAGWLNAHTKTSAAHPVLPCTRTTSSASFPDESNLLVSRERGAGDSWLHFIWPVFPTKLPLHLYSPHPSDEHHDAQPEVPRGDHRSLRWDVVPRRPRTAERQRPGRRPEPREFFRQFRVRPIQVSGRRYVGLQTTSHAYASRGGVLGHLTRRGGHDGCNRHARRRPSAGEPAVWSGVLEHEVAGWRAEGRVVRRALSVAWSFRGLFGLHSIVGHSEPLPGQRDPDLRASDVSRTLGPKPGAPERPRPAVPRHRSVSHSLDGKARRRPGCNRHRARR